MRFEKKEVLLNVIAALLAIAGLNADDIAMVATLILSAAVLACYAVLSHPNRGVTFRSVACAAIVIAAGGAFYRSYSRNLQKELSNLEGVLYPANDSDAPIGPKDCIPAGALAIDFGGNWTYVTRFPLTVLQLSQRQTLIIDGTENDSIKIKNLEIFDDRYDVIATINDNKFWVKPGSEIQRPDFSTLIVRDHNNEIALNIRYATKRLLLLTGKFYTAHGSSLKFEKDDTIITPRAMLPGIPTAAICNRKNGIFTFSD